MNRVTRGTVVLAVALAALSCKGDPTDSLRNGVDHLVATPSSVFMAPGTSQSILVEAVDEQGNRQGTSFNLGTVGAGITVVEDDSFNLVFDKNGNQVQPKSWPRVQYIITANANTTNSSFVVSAGGKNLTIPVRTVPDSTTSLTLSTAAANVGDTVIATAPANFKFTPASVVTITGAAVATLGISADSSQISFVPGPGAASAVVVSNLVVSYATSLGGYSANSGAVALTTPGAASLGINATNAVAGDTIIVTAPAPYKFLPNSAVTVGTAGLAVIARAADSSSITFLIGPSAAAAVSVNNIVINNTPGAGTFTLTTGAAVLNTPAIPNFANTFSSTSPAINDTVTMTVPAGFRLLPTATVTIGGRPATIITRAADSLSVTLVPVPGTAASVPTVNGIALSFLTSVSLSLPGTVSLTSPAGLAGTDAFATAPTIPVPAAGQTVTFLDAGGYSGVAECTGDLGGPCRVYQIVVPTARTLALTLTWQGTTDLGIYTYDAAQSLDTSLLVCDGLGAGSGGQPETCSKAMPAGTYYIVVDSFSPFYAPPNNVDPTDFKLVIVGS